MNLKLWDEFKSVHHWVATIDFVYNMNGMMIMLVAKSVSVLVLDKWLTLINCLLRYQLIVFSFCLPPLIYFLMGGFSMCPLLIWPILDGFERSGAQNDSCRKGQAEGYLAECWVWSFWFSFVLFLVSLLSSAVIFRTNNAVAATLQLRC